MENKLTIYNTLSRQKELFVPLHAPHVGMYVCGPTVYGDAHLGHARPAITFDILFRYLTHLGYKVRYVRNITDVEEGLFEIQAGAVILAMGCRERSRGALNIPGYRPAGIYSAGTAQRLVNMEGYMPGREVVILGSGDIGLIMARRMTLEGAKVKVVAELMPYSGGLKRNIVQCLNDYDIPLKLSHTVVDIKGKERVEGITLAEVDGKGKPVPGTEEEYTCDTLLLSCGLIPENELSRGMGVDMNPVTSGPKVNESLETNIEGVFACGNVLHVHDLVDFVSEEAKTAGRNAAEYVKNLQADIDDRDKHSREEAAESFQRCTRS